jgi:hypothetical protein
MMLSYHRFKVVLLLFIPLFVVRQGEEGDVRADGGGHRTGEGLCPMSVDMT